MGFSISMWTPAETQARPTDAWSAVGTATTTPSRDSSARSVSVIRYHVTPSSAASSPPAGVGSASATRRQSGSSASRRACTRPIEPTPMTPMRSGRIAASGDRPRSAILARPAGADGNEHPLTSRSYGGTDARQSTTLPRCERTFRKAMSETLDRHCRTVPVGHGPSYASAPSCGPGDGLADPPGSRRRDGCRRLGPPDDVGPPARDRGTLGAAVVRGLERPLRLGRPDPARRARAARRRQHVSEPGADREARRDARPPVRRDARILGLGAAWFEREHDAHGIDFGRTVGERLDRLDEALTVIRRLVDGERFDFPGDHYQLHDAYQAPHSSAATCRSSSAARGRRRRCASWRRMRTRGIRPARSMS